MLFIGALAFIVFSSVSLFFYFENKNSLDQYILDFNFVN